MSEHKFTPGPWELVEDDRWSLNGFRIIDGQDSKVKIATTAIENAHAAISKSIGESQ